MAGITRAERERRQELLAQGLKQCSLTSGCGKTKPLEEFHRRARQFDGRQSRCAECQREIDAEWRTKNLDHHRQQVCEYYRARREADPLYSRLSTGAYKARALGNHVETFTSEDLIQHWKAQWIDPEQCIYCAGPFQQIDHIQPISQGGPHTMRNLVPACSGCNYTKKDRHFVDFLGARAEAASAKTEEKELVSA